MSLLKSKIGKIKWLAIYRYGNNFLLNDEDIKLKSKSLDNERTVEDEANVMLENYLKRI